MLYQLRIELKEVQPIVWRRLLVPENVTLTKLNSILYQTMGWHGGHLHEYVVGRMHYGIPTMTGQHRSLCSMSAASA